jgi:predicted RNase H-like HicB family nuclease
MRQVIVYPGEDGYYVVECPSLPGCVSQGPTKEQAIENIKEAIQAHTLALQDQGQSIPVEKFDPFTQVVVPIARNSALLAEGAQMIAPIPPGTLKPIAF